MGQSKFETEVRHLTGRSFHTNVEIGRSRIEYFATCSNTDQCNDQLRSKLGDTIGNMVYALLQIRNMKDIYVKPYGVSINMEGGRWNQKIDKIVKEAFDQVAIEKETSFDNEILVETFLNDRIRDYHLKIEISKSRAEDFYRPLRDGSQRYLDKIGSPGREIVEKLFDISGVVEVWIHPYKVGIEIANLFDWEDVAPQIEEVFRKVLNQDLILRNK